MELILQILFWCPRCWRRIGYILFTVCGMLALVSLRLATRVERIERKTGVVVDPDKVLEAIPLPIPSSAEGFALAVFGAMIGFAMAVWGKLAPKYM
eukprot:gene37636-50813_t